MRLYEVTVTLLFLVGALSICVYGLWILAKMKTMRYLKRISSETSWEVEGPTESGIQLVQVRLPSIPGLLLTRQVDSQDGYTVFNAVIPGYAALESGQASGFLTEEQGTLGLRRLINGLIEQCQA